MDREETKRARIMGEGQVDLPASSSDPDPLLQSLRIYAVRWTIPLVVLYFTGLTVFMTWPLVLRMRSQVIGSIGDNIYFIWMIGWVQKALFQLHANPFNVWFLNYPEGWSMAYTEITPAQLLLALPFSLLAGPTFGYNAAMLLTFVLSGLMMFLWVRRLTGSTSASLVAGTIFAFLPYRFAHLLIGHFNLSGTQWLPLYFWGLTDLLEARRFSWRPALLAGTGLGLVALTSQYYLYMSLLISVGMAAFYLLIFNRPQLRRLDFWKSLAAGGLVALPLVGVAVAPFVLLSQQGGLPDRNLAIVRMYSASPTDFLLPFTGHFLWGGWIGAHFNREMWVEGSLYIGAVALVLGMLAWIGRKQSGQPRLLWLFLVGGLAAFILALGTDLHWLGQPLGPFVLPDFLAKLLGRAEIPLPLPGYILFLYFPFYAKLRAFMRFGMIVLLFTTTAAGLGAAWLLQRSGRRAAWVVALLLALVFLDFYNGPFTNFATVTPRPVDTWLAAQPGSGAVAQFPFSEEEDQEQTYYTLTHGKPFIGGFFNAFPPPQYARIRSQMDTFPSKDTVALLKELGVQYVLVDNRRYPNMDEMRATVESLGLRFASQVGEETVFLMPGF